jgi:hypothetical protein
LHMPIDPPKRLSLLRARNRGGTSDYALVGVQEAFVRQGVPAVINDGPITRFVGKVLKNLKVQGSIYHVAGDAYILPMMGPQTFRAFPQGLVSELVPYIFDCWPAAYDEWERFFRTHRIRTAFISARQSAERMKAQIPRLNAIWMPEAIDPRPYNGAVPLSERRIDLLELGRRSEVFHDRITKHCVRRGLNHAYQRSPTDLVFAGRSEFLAGMAQAKILACFPSSMTHPDRSGDVETLTLRYLEGIASGSILLGRCPDELRTLFGYDPVVAADLDDPGAQLDAMLGSLDRFAPAIERNRARLYEVGCWDQRVGTMLSILRSNGYRVTDAGSASLS